MDTIDRVRRFNRAYTRATGLLNRSYLDSGLSLTQVRVLLELVPAEATARDLSGRLGLDEGYLSRLVAGFRARGWVAGARSRDDARRVLLSLTPAGRQRIAALQDAARRGIADLLAPLSAAERAELTAAMARIESLLAPDEARPVTLRDLRPGDAGWLIGQHAELYARDEGYDHSFEALVAEILAGFIRDHDPACERGWIAESEGTRLGSIFCVNSGTPGLAKLRLFLLVPEARGRGLGRRLLETCMDFAREAGYRRMTLWTHESHRAACALYAKAGFTLTGSESTRSFGQDVVEQTWEIDLVPPLAIAAGPR